MDSLGGAMRPELHIDWVITVPAIWDAAGKQMMREAGYKVLFYYYCCGIWEGDIDIAARLGQQFHEPLPVNYGIGYSQFPWDFGGMPLQKMLRF